MSKGLELIKRRQPEIIDGFPTGNIYIGVTKEELAELEKELKEGEKLEETMKLIVRKAVNISYLIELIKTPSRYGALYNYNCDYDEGDFRRLTETEFNQIKEVIKKYGRQ